MVENSDKIELAEVHASFIGELSRTESRNFIKFGEKSVTKNVFLRLLGLML